MRVDKFLKISRILKRRTVANDACDGEHVVVNGKRVKIFSTTVNEKNGEAGKVLCENPLTVACGNGSVIIHELQLEGKKRMKSDDFVRGYRITTDTVFE